MKYGNEVTELLATDLERFMVKLKFKNGKKGRISLNHIFHKPKNLSAEILRAGMFEKCFVESGALAWPNGFELCPDALYEWMMEQEQDSVA